jgi:hypothetical protein
MDADKLAQLDSLMNTLQSRWGVGAVRRLSDLPREPHQGLHTGFSALDTLLGKRGIPRGQVTELMGRLTSGMTTLAYCTMACQPDYAIYIDLDGTFDPEYAVRCGVRLDRFFLARTDTEGQALDIARDLLTSRGVGLIVMDVGEMQLDLTRLQRLRSVLSHSGCAVLLLMVLPAVGEVPTLNSPASIRLLVERVKWLERYADIRGYQSRVTLLKHPTAMGKSALIDIDFDALPRGTAI